MSVTLPIVSDGLQSRRLDCEVVDLVMLMDVVLRGVCPPENEKRWVEEPWRTSGGIHVWRQAVYDLHERDWCSTPLQHAR